MTAPNEHTRSEFVKQYEGHFPGAMIAFNDPCAIPLHILKVTKAPTNVVLVPHYEDHSTLIGYIALFPVNSSFVAIQSYARVLYDMGIRGPDNRFKNVEQPYCNKNEFRFGVLLTLSDIDKLNAFAKSDKTSPSVTFQISAHESISYQLTFNWQKNEQHILLDSDIENAKKFMALLSQFGIAQPDGSEKTLLKYEDERGYVTALNDSEIEKLHQALQGKIAADVLTSPVAMFGQQRIETTNAPTEVTSTELCCTNL